MFRHAHAVNKLQLGLHGSNRGLKATGVMFTTCDEEAKRTVMGSMGMALTIRRVAGLSHVHHKLLLLGLLSGLHPQHSTAASCTGTSCYHLLRLHTPSGGMVWLA